MMFGSRACCSSVRIVDPLVVAPRCSFASAGSRKDGRRAAASSSIALADWAEKIRILASNHSIARASQAYRRLRAGASDAIIPDCTCDGVTINCCAAAPPSRTSPPQTIAWLTSRGAAPARRRVKPDVSDACVYRLRARQAPRARRFSRGGASWTWEASNVVCVGSGLGAPCWSRRRDPSNDILAGRAVELISASKCHHDAPELSREEHAVGAGELNVDLPQHGRQWAVRTKPACISRRRAVALAQQHQFFYNCFRY